MLNQPIRLDPEEGNTVLYGLSPDLTTSLSYTLPLCIWSKDGDGKPGVCDDTSGAPVFASPGPLGLQNQWFSPLQFAVD